MHATPWLSLKNIILSERSQARKTTCFMIPFICNVQKRQIHRNKSKLVVARAGGMGRELCKLGVNGRRLQISF
jgi:hypothetical protein